MFLNTGKVLAFIYIFSFLLSCKENVKNDFSVKQTPSSSSFPTLHLMPVPAQLNIKKGTFRITKDFSLLINEGAHERLYKAADRFLRRLDGRVGLFFTQGYISKADPQKSDKPQLFIAAQREGKVELNEDESYQLIITPEKIVLNAATDIGALRGLETLLQLQEADANGYYFPSVEITDQPRFPWRGLMIDVARHYEPMDVLKRNLDAMAAMKMNVFHFHLCDNQGWRVESKVFPLLHQKASDGMYYTQEEIKEIVRYANDRGIRVMPEFDVPGHATAMLVAYPELGSAPGPYTLERDAGIFNPVLNPTIDKTYAFLEKLFTEMVSLFPDPYFHIGGDENNGRDWKNNPEIQAFMKKNQLHTVLELQTYFNNRLIKIIKKLNKKMVGWEEILQPGLSQDAIIHSWKGRESLYRAATLGYQTILSNGYYIDLLYPASDHYLNDPLPDPALRTEREKQYKLTPEQEKLILGGEATMWAELVTPVTIDSRIWPRTAAIAERLWSTASVRDVNDMYRRLEFVSFRLEELGLTHIKNRDMMLRSLANGGDITPLKVLIGVIEPYKEYTRNGKGVIYKSYSPYSLMADVASSDAEDARIFTKLVNDYCLNPNKEIRDQLINYLTIWKNNHKEFLKITSDAPVLKSMEKLSEKLSMAAQIGLEAMDKVSASESWYNEKTNILTKIQQETEEKKRDSTMEDGRTELMIVEPLQKLIDRTNPEAAKQRLVMEEEAKKKKEAATIEH